MRRSLLAMLAGPFAVAACSLFTGVGDLTTSSEQTEGGTDPSPDGALDAPGLRGDAASIEAGDSSTGCIAPAATPNTSGAQSARRAPGTIIVDGVLDEWRCVPFTRVDRASAGRVVGAPDAGTADTFAMEYSVVWEPSALYFAARVSNASIDGGNATSGIFRNDSIELYLANEVLIGHAGPNDPQLIVDHANRAESYRVGFPSAAPMAAPLGFTSAVQKKGSTIVFELRVAASVLGMANLADGAKLGFDNAVNDGDGMTQRTQLIWYMAPTCSCTLGCCCGMARDEPYCNTQRYGSLTLAP